MVKKFYFILLIFISSVAAAQKTYIQCGKLIDGISDKPLEHVTIIVDGNIITDIKNGYMQGDAGDKLIFLKDKTVMPGLIDCHVHLESQGNKNSLLEGFTLTDADIAYHAAVYAKRTLMAGFTTVRDLGGTGVNISLRKAVAQGLL